MARPRLGDSDSKRLQMVITEDELAAIDDWQHANKVASRSEAIRRLCQIAMVVDRELDEIVDHAAGLRAEAEAHLDEAHEVFRAFKLLPDDPNWEILRQQLQQSLEIFERANAVHVLATAAFNRIVPLMDSTALAEAMRRSEEAQKDSQKIFDKINAMLREQEENSFIAHSFSTMGAEEREALNNLSDEEQEAWFKENFEKYLAEKDRQADRQES